MEGLARTVEIVLLAPRWASAICFETISAVFDDVITSPVATESGFRDRGLSFVGSNAIPALQLPLNAGTHFPRLSVLRSVRWLRMLSFSLAFGFGEDTIRRIGCDRRDVEGLGS